MGLDNANIFKARGYALQGAAFVIFLYVFAFLSFRLGRFEVAFTFIPLAGIFLWPHNASRGLSLCLIFILGLGVDVLSAGPAGLWAFIYLLLYGMFRPDRRGRFKNLSDAAMPFVAWVGLTLALILTIGALFIPGRTHWVPLVGQAVAVILFFPLIYVINTGLHKLLLDPDSAEAGT